MTSNNTPKPTAAARKGTGPTKPAAKLANSSKQAKQPSTAPLRSKRTSTKALDELLSFDPAVGTTLTVVEPKTSKRAAKPAPAPKAKTAKQLVAEGNGMSVAELGDFAKHVHTETGEGVHTSWAACAATSCTYASSTVAARRKAEAAAKPAAKPTADAATLDEIARLAGQVANATVAYEAAVVAQLRAGVSPSVIGKAVGIADSSIRRIGMRHNLGTK